MKEIINANAIYPVYMVNNRPYLFTDCRVDKESVPNGMHLYEIADCGGDGCFARIQPNVRVNFWGTLIGKDEIPIREGAYYPEYGTLEYEGWMVDEADLTAYMEYTEEDIARFQKNEFYEEDYFLRDGCIYTAFLTVRSCVWVGLNLRTDVPLNPDEIIHGLQENAAGTELEILDDPDIRFCFSNEEKTMADITFHCKVAAGGLRTQEAVDILNDISGVDLYAEFSRISGGNSI